MKPRLIFRVPFLLFGCFLSIAASGLAGTFSGKVSDLDAGNGYLTVTSRADQTTQTFRVISETVIVNSAGQPSQLLNLIEGTLVAVDPDPGDGELAAKITVLPSAEEPP
jgi:hypothetical protein